MTDALAPLACAVPLVAAALCGALGPWVPRRAIDVLSIAAGLFSLVAAAIVTTASAHRTVVHWFGGWHPHHGVVLGIAFVVDPIGGAFATLTAVLTTAAFIFAWTYYDEGGPPFHSLMLVFLGALVGFFLTGDLFNLFVFFELMGVAAYALTSYRTEDESAVMGAITFAVVNSTGAFAILLGIAMVYGRTGALNMAQIAHALGGSADRLVLVAFAFIIVGLLVKGAIAPFHFWLADAHAVAPTPLCVLFSGIMVQAGLYAVARVYWSVFSGVIPPSNHALRALLLGFGLLTAAVGATMCLRERHFKRLLAFSTITHSGILLCALALLSARAVAGMSAYILGHGLIKGALFMCSGVLLNRMGSVDVDALRGALRGRWWIVTLIALGALGLAGLPPFGTFVGKSLIDDAARDAVLGWLSPVLLVAAASTGAAVLIALGHMAFGWGPPPDPQAKSPEHEIPETSGGDRGMPFVMLGTATVLLALALCVGAVHGPASSAVAAGLRFVDRPLQLAVTLHGTTSGPLPAVTAPSLGPSLFSGIVSAALAVAFAAGALFGHRAGAAWERARQATDASVAWLQGLHSGLVSDYIAWFAAGTAAFGVALAAAICFARS